MLLQDGMINSILKLVRRNGMKKILNIFFISIYLVVLTGCSNEKVYGIHEKIDVTNSVGEYGIEITNVEVVKSNKNENVVIVTYELENRTISSSLNRDEWNFTAYDKDNNSLDNYLILDQNNKSASLGETIEMKIGYYFNSNKKYLKLKYFDDYISAKENATFVLEW